ncbi:MAG: ABC-2 family transporter protein [Patescibacteria group bacterium]
MLKKYAKIYIQLVNCAFSSYLSNRIDSLCFFLGKIIRFLFFLLLIISIFRFTENLAGYGIYEVIFFFLTFNFIDIAAQFLFRGVYTFKQSIILGYFDYILSKPVNALFYIMNKLVDILDLIFLCLISAAILYNFKFLAYKISMQEIFLYIFFIFNAIVIVFALHVLIVALSIRFYEADNLIWLYRDSLTVGRMPPEIFSDSIRFLFTVIIPVFAMIAFPVKAALGILELKQAIFGIIFAFFIVIFSLWFWKSSLRYYSSASS